MKRQLSIGEALKPPEKRFSERLSVPVVDLFASIGGFSCGARDAGHSVVLAAESELNRVQVHTKNHPDCVHLCTDLPDDRLLTMLPAPGTLWHLHGSPPCQNLSKANGGNVREKDEACERTGVGLEMVEWFLDLVRSARPATWSMEQVNHPEVLALLTDRGLAHCVAPFEEWGLPQSRVRVIAGSDHLIRRFQGLRNPARKVAVCDVMALPVPGARIKGSTANYSAATKPGSNVNRVVPPIKRARCATKPSLTVIGVGHTLVWTDHEGETIRQVSVRENATFQGFPKSYKFHTHTTKSNIQIGDAFPPMIAEQFMSDYRLPSDLWPQVPQFPEQIERPSSPTIAHLS